LERRSKPIIIIEHLEDTLGTWVFLEYRHSSMIYGKEYLWFTNIPLKYHRLMQRYGRVFKESILQLIERNMLKTEELLILDPRAEETLAYSDLLDYKYIVVGGILGDHPPRGRTYELLTSRIRGVDSRNIGDKQYSIDGSVYYVEFLWKNKSMENYEFVDGVTLDTNYGNIYLPYRYPLINNKPLIAPGLVEYLKNEKLPREILEEIGLTK